MGHSAVRPSCSPLMWGLASPALLLLLLLSAGDWSWLCLSGTLCRHNTLLPLGSTSRLDTAETRQRIMIKTGLKMNHQWVYCLVAIRTHSSPAGYGSHTCAARCVLLVLQSSDWPQCPKRTGSGSSCRPAWTEPLQHPVENISVTIYVVIAKTSDGTSSVIINFHCTTLLHPAFPLFTLLCSFTICYNPLCSAQTSGIQVNSHQHYLSTFWTYCY